LFILGSEIPEVIGAVLQAIGFAGIAVAVLRRSNRVVASVG